MQTYMMLTRLAHGALQSPRSLEELEQQVMHRIRRDCPHVKWLSSYAALGPSDYVDFFQAADNEMAMKVATVVRTFGHARTEVWPVTEWKRFKEIVSGIAVT